MPGTACRDLVVYAGGPSHLETFDPKPELSKQSGKLLPEEFRKFDLAQINTADATVLGGQFDFKHVNPVFPFLHYSHLQLRRISLQSFAPATTSFSFMALLTMMHSGTRLLGHPSVGSWVTYGIGSETEELQLHRDDQ